MDLFSDTWVWQIIWITLESYYCTQMTRLWFKSKVLWVNKLTNIKHFMLWFLRTRNTFIRHDYQSRFAFWQKSSQLEMAPGSGVIQINGDGAVKKWRYIHQRLDLNKGSNKTLIQTPNGNPNHARTNLVGLKELGHHQKWILWVCDG